MIDYSNVITRQQLKQIDKEKYEFAVAKGKEAAKMHNDKLRWNYRNQNNVPYEGQAIKQVISDVDAYQFKEDDIVKTIIKCNIMFSKPENLITILLDNKVHFNILNTMITRINKLQQLTNLNNRLQKLLNTNITDENLKLLRLIINRLQEETNISNQNFTKIINLLKHYYPATTDELTINRLVQLVVFEKDLYLTMEEEHKQSKKMH